MNGASIQNSGRRGLFSTTSGKKRILQPRVAPKAMRLRRSILAFSGVASLVVGTWVGVHLWNRSTNAGDQGAPGSGGDSHAAHTRRLPSITDPAAQAGAGPGQDG